MTFSLQRRMEKSRIRKSARFKKDIISELPQNLKETILCLLPIRDAVRTAILSRDWRHCWTTIPQLAFDDIFLDSVWDNYLEHFHDEELKMLKFVSVINKVILLHNGPILKFSLSCPQDIDNDTLVFQDYIDQWIPLLSRNGIKQLTIEGFMSEHSTALNFSSLNLTHLRLVDFWFPYTPASGGLTCLKYLELIDVVIAEEHVFDCPVLEKLTLVNCEGLFRMNFRAPHLKYFHQLVSFMTPEISLAGLQNLIQYSFWLSRDAIVHTKAFNVVKVLSCLPKIEKFSVGMNFIKADKDTKEGDLEDYWKKVSQKSIGDHLKIVIFSHFRGLKAELELVQFLLGHSPLLKTMFIHCGQDINKDVALAAAEEMLRFPRASTRAEIKHLEHVVEDIYSI
ncbi:F-box/FBD/LRR-repeat protein At1g13570 [Daucus carota subsp. sativus]|uniref:F-box/FBD/LRR-repeat protein At1g13570 n=1 Tax=Daucus carota subsp. sativus TaxID=79200 RepID=UPI0007EF17F0|nr:PREDICTED: F-box/FBD/LRR-repeat protein At1g13570-like [Daucus carota subsp. sativus]